jgi:iron(III) transport system substrate-binding protein
MVEQLGFVSVLKGAKVPPGAPKDIKLWFAPAEEYAALRDKWIEEWNTIYNYR